MIWLIAVAAACGFFASGCWAMSGALSTPIYQHEEESAHPSMLAGLCGMIGCGLILGGCLEHLL